MTKIFFAWILPFFLKCVTDRQTYKQTDSGGYRVAPQLTILNTGNKQYTFL